jgi:hypothetical protein
MRRKRDALRLLSCQEHAFDRNINSIQNGDQILMIY